MKQVGAKSSPLHLFLQVAVGGCKEADIDPDALAGSYPLYLPFLYHSQELGLDGRRKLPDLIQKEGPAIRHFEFARSVADGSREGSPGVAKKLALGETLGKCRAVEAEQRSIPAR